MEKKKKDQPLLAAEESGTERQCDAVWKLLTRLVGNGVQEKVRLGGEAIMVG